MKTICVLGADTALGRAVRARLSGEPDVAVGSDPDASDAVIDPTGRRVRSAGRVARIHADALADAPRALRLPVLVPVPADDRPVQLVHLADVADALARAALRGAEGDFALATDEPLRGAAIARAIGRTPLSVPDPGWLRGVSREVRDPSRARRELGWRPRWPTTGAVLRALSGRPAAVASRPTLLLLGSMAALTRVRGSLPLPRRTGAELSGMSGVINWALTGDRPSEWRIILGGGQLGFRAGLTADPIAGATMTERTFHDVLSGALPWPRAMMTGRVRMTGDGGYGLVVGGIVGGLRQILSGWPRLAARLLRPDEVPT